MIRICYYRWIKYVDLLSLRGFLWIFMDKRFENIYTEKNVVANTVLTLDLQYILLESVKSSVENSKN